MARETLPTTPPMETTVREGNLAERMNELSNTLSDLRGAVIRLDETIQPILLPPSPSASGPDQSDSPEMSPAARYLSEQIDVARALRWHVESLIDRADV